MNIFGVHQECSLIDGSVGKIEFDIYQKSRIHGGGVRIFGQSGHFIDLQESIYDDIIGGIGWRYGRSNTSNVNDTRIKHYILVNLDEWDIKELVSEYDQKSNWFVPPRMEKFLKLTFPRLVSFYRSYQIDKII